MSKQKDNDSGWHVGDGSNKNRIESESKGFDAKTFHQLRLMRLENLKKLEQERVHRHVLRSSPRLDNNSTLPSQKRAVDFPTADVVQVPNTEIDETCKVSNTICIEQVNEEVCTRAKLELLTLGRRYASVQEVNRRRQLIDDTNHPDSSLQNNISAISPPEINRMNYQVVENQCSSIEGVGVHGIYLLLARSTFPPNRDPFGNTAANDEDRSTSESYSSPTPHLQIILDDEESCDQQDATKTETLSSFYTVRLFHSDSHDKSSRSEERDNFGCQKNGNDWKRNFFVIFILVALAAAAIWFCWSCRLFKLTRRNYFDTSLISKQYSAHSQWMQSTLSFARTIIVSGIDKLLSFPEHLTLRGMIWKENFWINPVSKLTSIDWFSLIIRNMYRIQKIYRAARTTAYAGRNGIVEAHRSTLMFINFTKQSLTGIQEIRGVTWNNTVIFVTSLWKSMISEHLLNTPREFETQLSLLSKSTLTSSVYVFCPEHDCGSLCRSSNMTQSPENLDKSRSVIGSRFWRNSIELPFLRSYIPLRRQAYLHSIPSSEELQGRISNPISLSSTLFLEQNPRGYSESIIFLSRSRRLTLKNPRLDSIAISSDIRNNVAASMIMKKTRPPKVCQFCPAITKATKRNYYDSSYYPLEGHLGGKDVFEDVDINSMVHEFWNVLKRFRLNSG